MSADYPNRFSRYPSSFRMRRPIQPMIKQTITNGMNAELNAELNRDWDDDINTDIWVSTSLHNFSVGFHLMIEKNSIFFLLMS